MTSRFSQPIVCPIIVGREEALSGLELLRRKAGERGLVALVCGEAGIGKSRVIAAFLESEVVRDGLYTVTHFFEHDAGLPYSGMARCLASLATRPEETRRILAPVAAELSPLAPELLDLVTGPAPTPRADDAPEEAKRRILEALVRLIRSLSRERPLTLVFEDAHWADELSLEALLRIAREAVPGCLLVLTYRDDEVSPALGTVLGELDRARLGSEIRLGGLRLADVDRMLKACVGSDRSTRADVLHVIHQLTGGNPFYVEEITRSLLDHAGTLDSLDTLHFGAFELPRGVHESVRRRVQGLSRAARDLLSLAAVAGVRFDIPLLFRLSQVGEEELLPLLKELIAAQLVVEESEDRFAFRHALTREAILSSLLRRERRALSRQVGEAVESLNADDLDARVEDLAGHFHQAGQWEKAFRYSLRAGERAMALYAPSAALTHLSRAIDAGEQLAGVQLGEAYHLRGVANEAVGDFEAARIDYEHAAFEAGSPNTRWRALLDLGLLWAARDYSRSEAYYRQALELAREIGDSRNLAHSFNRMGNWHSNQGDFESARALSEEALQLFRTAGDREGEAQTLDLLGMTCTQALLVGAAAAYYREAIPLLEELGDFRTLTSALASIQIGSATYQTNMLVPALTLPEGSDFGQRALSVARRLGWKSAESYALWQLAFSLGPQGEYEKALACCSEALSIAREIGHTQWEVAAECALGAVYSDILALEAAEEHLRRAEQLAGEMASTLWRGQAYAFLIDALVAARRVEEAGRLYDSITVNEPLTFGPRQVYTSGAELALARGDIDGAVRMLERLEESAGATTSEGIALRVARLRGRALAAAGDLAAAEDQLRRAEVAARLQGDLSHVWRLSADLAAVLLAAGEREPARVAAAAASEVIDTLAQRIESDDLRSGFLTRAHEYLPASLRRRSPGHVEGLTAREAEIAALIAGGLTNREVAGRLVLSTRTVETHVANAMAKLGFSSRSQLAAWAANHGLIAPDS